MKFTFLIYSVGQTITLLILVFKYNIFAQTPVFSCYYTVFYLLLLTLYWILSTKSPGSIRVFRNTSIDESITSCQNFSNVQMNYLKETQRNNNSCLICGVNKRLRSQHCPTCQKCIPTFDHHCAFLGKCIGQKNRQIFYLFSFFQTLQGLILIMFLVSNLIKTGDRSNGKLMLISFSLIVTFLMGTLLAFETYFMVYNLTMEEFKNRGKHSFRTEKFPYSRGILQNLYFFWILSFKTEPIIWENQIIQSQKQDQTKINKGWIDSRQ